MRKTVLALTATVLLALGLFVASGQAPAQPRGVLSILHVDEQVSLKETPTGYEIGVFENGPGLLGNTVVEVGSDYVVLRNAGGVTTTRIPIYSIRAVVIMKIGKAE